MHTQITHCNGKRVTVEFLISSSAELLMKWDLKMMLQKRWWINILWFQILKIYGFHTYYYFLYNVTIFWKFQNFYEPNLVCTLKSFRQNMLWYRTRLCSSGFNVNLFWQILVLCIFSKKYKCHLCLSIALFTAWKTTKQTCIRICNYIY